MKKFLFLSLLIFLSCAQQKDKKHVAEISCGQCQFNIDGEGCSLAVRFNDKAYYVNGFTIDDFGDAHDEHTGFCNVIRKGKIKGIIEDGIFIASALTLTDK